MLDDVRNRRPASGRYVVRSSAVGLGGRNLVLGAGGVVALDLAWGLGGAGTRAIAVGSTIALVAEGFDPRKQRARCEEATTFVGPIRIAEPRDIFTEQVRQSWVEAAALAALVVVCAVAFDYLELAFATVAFVGGGAIASLIQAAQLRRRERREGVLYFEITPRDRDTGGPAAVGASASRGSVGHSAADDGGAGGFGRRSCAPCSV